jgi:hypothetical protein
LDPDRLIELLARLFQFEENLPVGPFDPRLNHLPRYKRASERAGAEGNSLHQDHQPARVLGLQDQSLDRFARHEQRRSRTASGRLKRLGDVEEDRQHRPSDKESP